jgi:single-stranded-DNA-specific exonuclease
MKRWVFREEIPREASENLSEYPKILRDLFFSRGIETKEAAEIFLKPNYERDFLNPLSLLNMERACERIEKGIARNEKIAIYADYDADGIPGSVVLSDFFKSIGFENFRVYIPHRYKEGYGLNSPAISLLKEKGISLIVTIDCGITDVKEVEHANTLGIDVIVTDHHLPGKILPPAYTIVNPNQKGDTYKNSNLCGGGLAFKLVQALIARKNVEHKIPGSEKWLLDVAGISTISDMVPLVGENRALAYFGIQVLKQTRREGLLKLFAKKRLSPAHLSEEDVGFVISPHINAASRMSTPELAFRLLSTEDAREADDLVSHLSQKNEERKTIVEGMLSYIEDILSEEKVKNVISMGSSSWHPGLLGLAANRVVEKYRRPVCLWGAGEDGVIRGSCRSDGTVNIVELMGNVSSSYFLDFGGHEHSGGFSVAKENINDLEEKFLLAYEESSVKKEENTKELFIDKHISKEDITWSFYEIIASLAPFGVGNEKPLFLIKNLKVLSASFFGKGKNHMKVLFEGAYKKVLPGISFFVDPRDYAHVKPESYFDIVCNIEKELFYGRLSLRLRVIDMKESVL